MYRGTVVLGVAALGLALGVVAIDVARDDPGYWFAGDSTIGVVALLGAGWSLLGCGLGLWWRWPQSRSGPLLAAAGCAWFLPELNNPGAGSLAFTTGLMLSAVTPALVGHAVLGYPAGRLSSIVQRVIVAVAYMGTVLVLGVVPTLLTDPAAEACNQCPRNLALVEGHASVADDVIRSGVALGLGWALALASLVVARLVRASSVARPLFAAGAVYLALTAAMFAVWLDRGYLSTGTLERRLWLGQAAALIAIAVGVAWGWVRARRARASVARLVVDLAQSPPPGGLRDALAEIVGDPGLVLAYPVGADGLVDAHGRSVELPAEQGRTTLVRDGQPVAVLGHAPGLLDDEQLVDEVTAAARLALENERLQAEVRARLRELRASRARIVDAGDAERKRLERDLHDGAQQRLVGLTLSLRLLRMQRPDSRQLEQADDELRLAIADLRELAHGIFPAVLADEGLAAAIEALAEEGGVPMRIGAMPDERFAAPVESAAYAVVAEALRAAPAGLAVRAEHADGLLAVDVETAAVDGLDLVGLQDRIGALDGRLEVANENGHARIHAELPCGS
jgi:signal transduction histidine kinase